jgi:eukaryotic-like serine/threonine-protein kinase
VIRGPRGIRMPSDTDVPAAPAPSPLERRIGPYRILRQLGQGGMGMVYLAARADEHFEKRVALKVVRAGADSAAVVRHFKRERQILAGLDHPNIARLLDGGTTDDGLPYFVMDYVEGEPLLPYCEARGLSVAARLRLFQALCSAVQYAHRSLVVHRDIKPGNILVAADGTPKLLDFGIAKLVDPELADDAPTGTALAMTPEYASPEQARGEPITTATDVYSLGVVLYNLLTGQHPYRLTSRQPLDVLKAVLEQDPEKPSIAVERALALPATVVQTRGLASGGGMGGEATRRQPAAGPPAVTETTARAGETTPDRLRRRLRGDLDNILMMALRKEPQRRYASVEAFSEDIQRYLEGRPVAARRPTVAYRTGKFVRRHAAAVGAAAAALVLLVGFTGAMAVQSARVARERDVARHERSAAERERATAQRERATAQRVSAFLVDLFKISDPGEARGNSVTAREMLDKGTAKIRTELKDQPEVRATLMATMGDVYRRLGLYDKAAALLEEALEIRKETLGSAHPDVAASLGGLASLRFERGDYPGAESLYREALAIRRRALGNEHPDVAKTLNDLAGVVHEKGDYAQAESLYRVALAMRRKLLGDEHPDVAKSLNDLATVLYGKGDYAGAEKLQREALALKRRLLGDDHPDVANGEANLAVLLREKGDYAGAEVLHRQALTLTRKLYGSAHPRVAMSLASLADTLCLERKAAEAEPFATEALAVFKKTLPSGHPYIAETESVLGGCLALEHRFREAETLLLRSYPVLAVKGSLEGREALERIVRLYEEWGKAEQAARYRAELAAFVKS